MQVTPWGLIEVIQPLALALRVLSAAKQFISKACIFELKATAPKSVWLERLVMASMNSVRILSMRPPLAMLAETSSTQTKASPSKS